MIKLKQETINVNSAAIKTADYDYELNTLTLTFNNGRQYDYFKVEPYVYEGMRNSNSIGSFINRNIIRKHNYVQK